uniref:Predicted GPI-anchored protein 58 n=1 Tax=Nicotiana sylvestris TaxID=4096 RepID=A0A1U7XIC0_NICSY|nr:PREDICTED: predicted GPI-anchored protein 58 [Nicotiana sylvestris]
MRGACRKCERSPGQPTWQLRGFHRECDTLPFSQSSQMRRILRISHFANAKTPSQMRRYQRSVAIPIPQPEPAASASTRGKGQGRGRCWGRVYPRAAALVAEPHADFEDEVLAPAVPVGPAQVDKRPYNIKVKGTSPFSWYSVKGNDNPKDKNYKAPASASTSQSEEPVAVEAPAEPASTSAEMPPGPSTSSAIPPGPSTSAGPEIPSSWAHPITAYRLTPAAEPQPKQSQRPPKRKRMIPRADDAIIQLVDPAETSSSQPQGVPDPEPVQAQVPAAKQ